MYSDFLCTRRWVLLRDFLLGEKELYDAVLFTDVRDVLCQADPFAYMVQDKDALLVFREASPSRRGEDGTIGMEQRNKGTFPCSGLSMEGNVIQEKSGRDNRHAAED